MDLTARQRAIYELRQTEPPVPYAEIADRFGISTETAISTVKRAKKKLERMERTPNKPTTYKQPTARLESKRPDDVAAFLDAVTDPGLRSIAQAARDCGLPDSVIQGLMKRISGEYQPVQRELQRVKTENLVREFENLGVRALQSITDEDIREVNAYQRTLMAAIAIDKRELLDGRPTERISHEDRRKLPELIEVLMQEASSRGLMKEVNPETGRVSLMIDHDASPEVKTGRARVRQETVEVEQP